jgi:hypothetical protein
MSKRTQQCYTRSVRMLVQHYDKTPDLIAEDELQEYFFHRLNVIKWASNTMRICYSKIKFFKCMGRNTRHFTQTECLKSTKKLFAILRIVAVVLSGPLFIVVLIAIPHSTSPVAAAIGIVFMCA